MPTEPATAKRITLTHIMGQAEGLLYGGRSPTRTEAARLAGTYGNGCVWGGGRVCARTHAVALTLITARKRPSSFSLTPPPPAHLTYTGNPEEVVQISAEAAQRHDADVRKSQPSSSRWDHIVKASDVVRRVLDLPARQSEAQRAALAHARRHEVRVPPHLDTPGMTRIQPQRVTTLAERARRSDQRTTQRETAAAKAAENSSALITEVCACTCA